MTEPPVASVQAGDDLEESKSVLKVLFFVTRDWYHPETTGGDNTMWEYARYLASVGHLVSYIAASYAGAAEEEVVDGIRVVRLGGIHSLWLRTFLYYMLHCRGKYDVVISEGFGGSRIPRLAPLYVREPIITAWHQIHRDLFTAQYPRILRGPLNLLERFAAWVHRDTLVQAYTPDWKQAFPAIGFKPENVFVVPVSIRDEWLIDSSSHQAPGSTALWIGKLRRYKCPDHVIRAMETVIRSVPQARLIIVARHDDLTYENQLRDLVSDIGLDDNIDFVFNVSEEQKRDLLRSSRLLVLPSSVEGFGIVVLEANACGVPVIASSGVPQGAVTDGENGLRYPFGQLDELSQRITQLLTDDEQHARLSANSLAFAKQFSWRNVSRQYEAIVQRVALEHRPHR